MTFEGGETNFLVGDPKNPQKVGFKNLTKIEGDVATTSLATQARQQRVAELVQNQAAQPAAADASALPPGLQEKMKSEQQVARGEPQGENSPEIQAMQAQAMKQLRAEQALQNSGPSAPRGNQPAQKAEGFPNGLSE